MTDGIYVIVSAQFAETWSEHLCMNHDCAYQHSTTSDRGFVAGLSFSMHQAKSDQAFLL